MEKPRSNSSLKLGLIDVYELANYLTIHMDDKTKSKIKRRHYIAFCVVYIVTMKIEKGEKNAAPPCWYFLFMCYEVDYH